MMILRPELVNTVRQASSILFTLHPEIYRPWKQYVEPPALNEPRHVMQVRSGNLYISCNQYLVRSVLHYPMQSEIIAGSADRAGTVKRKTRLGSAKFTKLGGCSFIRDEWGRLELLLADTGAKSLVSLHVQFKSNGGSATVDQANSWAAPVSLTNFEGDEFLDLCRMGNMKFAFTTRNKHCVFLGQLSNKTETTLSSGDGGGQADSVKVADAFQFALRCTVDDYAKLSRPVSLCYADVDQVYVTDASCSPSGSKAGVKLIHFVKGDAKSTIDVVTTECGVPLGIGQLDNGDVVVSDSKSDTLKAINVNTGAVRLYAGGGVRKRQDGTGKTGHFCAPKGIAVEGDTVYVVCGDGSVRMFTFLEETARYMEKIWSYARAYGVLDPSERRKPGVRDELRRDGIDACITKLDTIVQDHKEWKKQRKLELGMPSRAQDMKGPEGVPPMQAQNGWIQNFNALKTLSAYFKAIGRAEFADSLLVAFMNSMAVEHIFAGQIRSIYDRKETAKMFLSNRDRNRWEKIKSRAILPHAYCTSDRKEQYLIHDVKINIDLSDLRDLWQTRASARSVQSRLPDRNPPLSVKMLVHIASRQREQANRDKLRRPPGLPLHLPSVQPSSDAIDDNDYLLFESKHGLLDVIIDSQRWTMI